MKTIHVEHLLKVVITITLFPLGLRATPTYIELRGSDLPATEQGMLLDYGVLELSPVLKRLASYQESTDESAKETSVPVHLKSYNQHDVNHFAFILRDLYKKTLDPNMEDPEAHIFGTVYSNLTAYYMAHFLGIRQIYEPAMRILKSDVILNLWTLGEFELPDINQEILKSAIGMHIQHEVPLFLNRDAMQEPTIIQAHRTQVRTIAIRPTGRMIASGGDDATIKLWDITTGKLIRTIYNKLESPFLLAFTPDGGTIIGVSEMAIRAWIVKDGELYTEINLFSNNKANVATTAALSADVHLIAIGRTDGYVQFWNYATGKYINKFQARNDAIKTLACSPNGRYIAVGSAKNNSQIRIFSCESGECLHSRGFDLHEEVRSLTFTGDSFWLAVGLTGGRLKLWNFANFDPANTIPTHADGHMHVSGKTVTTLASHPGGLLIASGSDDQTIQLWQPLNLIAASSHRRLLTLRTDSPVTRVTFSPTGHFFVSAHQNGTIRLWDVFPSWLEQLAPRQLVLYQAAQKELDEISGNGPVPAETIEDIKTLPRQAQAALLRQSNKRCIIL